MYCKLNISLNPIKGVKNLILILGVCSVILGVLGIVMSCYGLYLIVVNGKLEIKILEKEEIIAGQSELIHEAKKNLIEKEGFIKILREDISVKDRTINRLKRIKR